MSPLDTMPRPGLLVSQNAPAYTELSRLGFGYSVMCPTAVAATAAFPTTTANLEIWNNLTSGVNLVVDRLSVWEKVATAIVRTTNLCAQVTVTKAIPTLTAMSIGSLSGRQPSPYTSSVGTRVVTGAETTVVANGWTAWGDPAAWGTAAATPGQAYDAQVKGRLIVPPGCSLCVTLVGPTATGTYQVGASWYEVPTSTSFPNVL